MLLVSYRHGFSLVIQGPLHLHSLKRLSKYQESFSEIIVSHWENDQIDPEPYKAEGIKFIANNPTYPDTTFNCFNTWYHFNSTLMGLREVTKPFVIKVRSDNFIGNLKPMMDKVCAHVDKFVTSNLYFRPDRTHKFHPSDQVMGGATWKMLAAFETAVFRLENHSKELREGFNDHRMLTNNKFIYPIEGHKIPYASSKMPPGMGVAPEVILGTSCVAANLGACSIELSKEQMKSTFEIVKLEDMKPYLSKEGTNVIPHGPPEIHDIKDI